MIILLFEIGLETALRKPLRVGPVATVAGLDGVALPFALRYGTCEALGLSVLVFAGASLTATSVGYRRQRTVRTRPSANVGATGHPYLSGGSRD